MMTSNVLLILFLVHSCIRAFLVLPPLFGGRELYWEKSSSTRNLTIEAHLPKEAPIDGDTGCV